MDTSTHSATCPAWNALPCDCQTAATPRDSRDWRNMPTEKRSKRRAPRRQGTRQAVLQAYAREGGF